MKDILLKLFGGSAGGAAEKISGVVDKFIRTKDEKAAFDTNLYRGRIISTKKCNRKMEIRYVKRQQTF